MAPEGTGTDIRGGQPRSDHGGWATRMRQREAMAHGLFHDLDHHSAVASLVVYAGTPRASVRPGR